MSATLVAALLLSAAPAPSPAELEPAWTIPPEHAALAAGGPAAGHVDTALAVGPAALRTARSVEEGLVWAVNYGGDADTNGAVAGALLGARFGATSIPPRWLERLAKHAERVLGEGGPSVGTTYPLYYFGNPAYQLTAARAYLQAHAEVAQDLDRQLRAKLLPARRAASGPDLARGEAAEG